MLSLFADLQLRFRQIMFRGGCSQARAKVEVAVVKSCGASVRSGVNGAELDWSRPIEGSLSGTPAGPAAREAYLSLSDCKFTTSFGNGVPDIELQNLHVWHITNFRSLHHCIRIASLRCPRMLITHSRGRILNAFILDFFLPITVP